MSYPPSPTDNTPQQPYAAPPAYAPQGTPTEKSARNTLGLVAMIIAIVGFIFACIPGALIVGWLLLPIAFILGIVAVFLKGTKWQAITAIVVSVVGTIVGAIVFFAVVASSFNNAFSSGDTTVKDSSVSDEQATDEATSSEESATVGTRDNPAPIGTEIANDEWRVTINSVTTGAAAADAISANQFNEPADAGSEYIIVNYTVTYIGDDADGQIPAMVGVDYVTGGGATVGLGSKVVVAPESIDVLSTLYNGGTTTGNTAMQVPSPVDGVIVVRPGMVADKVFVAVQ